MRPTLMLTLGSLTSLMFACNAATEADLRSLAGNLIHGDKPGHGQGPAEPSCPIIAICQICDDGSCASATTPEGSCSPVTWVCPESPPLCGVPSICLTCPDDTCAEVVFDEDTCDDARWVCPDGSEIDFQP